MNQLIYYIKKLISNFIILMILFYQNTFSLLFPPSCKFSPSCSNYMILSIKKHGTIKGIFLGIKRIARCHPFSKGGYDPVK